VRVLDFGRYIAARTARRSGDLGADVIRIERAGGGEDRWVAPVAEDGAGAMYLVMNRNKRAMTLDPRARRARDRAQAGCHLDVVVANLPPECCARSRSTSRACAREGRYHPHHGDGFGAGGRGAASTASTASVR